MKNTKYNLDQLLTDIKFIGLGCIPGLGMVNILSKGDLFPIFDSLSNKVSSIAGYTSGGLSALSFVGLLLYGISAADHKSLNPSDWYGVRVERKQKLDSFMLGYSNKQFLKYDVDNSKTLDSTEFLNYYLKDRNYILEDKK